MGGKPENSDKNPRSKNENQFNNKERKGGSFVNKTVGSVGISNHEFKVSDGPRLEYM